MRLFLLLFVLWAPSAFAGQVQDALDALGPSGGVVELPCGTFHEEDRLKMPDHTLIRGSGPCTTIPPVTGVRNISERQFNLRLEDLIVDGNLGSGYIGIDFRNVTGSRIRDVFVVNVDTGILFTRTAYYNVVEDTFIDAFVDCFEITNGANENIIRGGKCSNARIGAMIYGVNNVSIERTAFEVVGTGILLGSGAQSTKLIGLRIESAAVGIEHRGTETVIMGIYFYAVGRHLIDRSGGQYWWYGP